MREAALAFGPFGSDYGARLERILERVEARSWIALSRGRRVGFAVLVPRRAAGFRPAVAAELVAIAVRPGWRRRGIGSLLLRTAAEGAREAGWGELRLWTALSNRPARRLFRAAGFAATVGGRARYPSGEPALEMVRAVRRSSR